MKIYGGGRGGEILFILLLFSLFFKTSYFSREEEKNSPLPPVFIRIVKLGQPGFWMRMG